MTELKQKPKEKDLNELLRTEGPAAVRKRIDEAVTFNEVKPIGGK